MKILIIDDNVDYANALCKLLQVSGYVDTHCVNRGAEGIEVAKKLKPDFLLLDIQMPDMDGYAVAAEIRKELSEKLPTLIAITGYGQEADRRKSQEAHFHFHLTKPFPISELKQILGAPALS